MSLNVYRQGKLTNQGRKENSPLFTHLQPHFLDIYIRLREKKKIIYIYIPTNNLWFFFSPKNHINYKFSLEFLLLWGHIILTVEKLLWIWSHEQNTIRQSRLHESKEHQVPYRYSTTYPTRSTLHINDSGEIANPNCVLTLHKSILVGSRWSSHPASFVHILVQVTNKYIQFFLPSFSPAK